MSRIDEKTFLLGIGAQKCGTSWLYHYLADRDDCFMSPIKELHYFDLKFLPEMQKPMHEILKRLVGRLKIATDFEVAFTKGLLPLLERMEMTYDDTAYRRYFETRVPESVSVFGEITPSYALLPKHGFREVKAQFPNTKIIYILRDPIERQISQMKMKVRKGNTSVSSDKGFFNTMVKVRYRPAATDMENYKLALRNPFIMGRSYYHETFKNLDAVFENDDIGVFFYETFFKDSELKRLCDFIGLPFIPGQYGTAVNAGGGGGTSELLPEHLAIARECLSEVYDYCRERFGDAIPESWHV